VIARHPGRPDLLLVKRAARREPGGWWLESGNPGAGAVDSRPFGVVLPDLTPGRSCCATGHPVIADRGFRWHGPGRPETALTPSPRRGRDQRIALP
jgi:hypothetical protein